MSLYIFIVLMIGCIRLCGSHDVVTRESIKQECDEIEQKVQALKESYTDEFYAYYHRLIGPYQVDLTLLQSSFLIVISGLVWVLVGELRDAKQTVHLAQNSVLQTLTQGDFLHENVACLDLPVDLSNELLSLEAEGSNALTEILINEISRLRRMLSVVQHGPQLLVTLFLQLRVLGTPPPFHHVVMLMCRSLAVVGMSWGGYEALHALWQQYQEHLELKPLEERLIFLRKLAQETSARELIETRPPVRYFGKAHNKTDNQRCSQLSIYLFAPNLESVCHREEGRLSIVPNTKRLEKNQSENFLENEDWIIDAPVYSPSKSSHSESNSNANVGTMVVYRARINPAAYRKTTPPRFSLPIEKPYQSDSISYSLIRELKEKYESSLLISERGDEKKIENALVVWQEPSYLMYARVEQDDKQKNTTTCPREQDVLQHSAGTHLILVSFYKDASGQLAQLIANSKMAEVLYERLRLCLPRPADVCGAQTLVTEMLNESCSITSKKGNEPRLLLASFAWEHSDNRSSILLQQVTQQKKSDALMEWSVSSWSLYESTKSVRPANSLAIIESANPAPPPSIEQVVPVLDAFDIHSFFDGWDSPVKGLKEVLALLPSIQHEPIEVFPNSVQLWHNNPLESMRLERTALASIASTLMQSSDCLEVKLPMVLLATLRIPYPFTRDSQVKPQKETKRESKSTQEHATILLIALAEELSVQPNRSDQIAIFYPPLLNNQLTAVSVVPGSPVVPVNPVAPVFPVVSVVPVSPVMPVVSALPVSHGVQVQSPVASTSSPEPATRQPQVAVLPAHAQVIPVPSTPTAKLPDENMSQGNSKAQAAQEEPPVEHESLASDGDVPSARRIPLFSKTAPRQSRGVASQQPHARPAQKATVGSRVLPRFVGQPAPQNIVHSPGGWNNHQAPSAQKPDSTPESRAPKAIGPEVASGITNRAPQVRHEPIAALKKHEKIMLSIPPAKRDIDAPARHLKSIKRSGPILRGSYGMTPVRKITKTVPNTSTSKRKKIDFSRMASIMLKLCTVLMLIKGGKRLLRTFR